MELVTYVAVGNEGVAPGLSGHWPGFVEDHVKLFDGTAFLHNFQKLEPIYPKRMEEKSSSLESMCLPNAVRMARRLDGGKYLLGDAAVQISNPQSSLFLVGILANRKTMEI